MVFLTQILRNANVVVYFFTDWCPICKSMSPVFESVASSGKFKDVSFCKVDCDLGKVNVIFLLL